MNNAQLQALFALAISNTAKQFNAFSELNVEELYIAFAKSNALVIRKSVASTLLVEEAKDAVRSFVVATFVVS